MDDRGSANRPGWSLRQPMVSHSPAARRGLTMVLAGLLAALFLAEFAPASTNPSGAAVLTAAAPRLMHALDPKVNPDRVKLGAPWPWVSPAAGLGAAHPRRLHYGGDGYSFVTKISWRNWGGRRATGAGIGWFVPRGHSNGEGYPLPIEITAFHRGSCGSGPAYTAFEMYFPTKGEMFTPLPHFDACNGGIVETTDPQFVRPSRSQ